jgi:predicted Fe-Mo cluster-binding NifX family protein
MILAIASGKGGTGKTSITASFAVLANFPVLAEKGVSLVIAGGMGGRAQQLFTDAGVTVIVGASSAAPESVVMEYLAGSLVTGANVCDH